MKTILSPAEVPRLIIDTAEVVPDADSEVIRNSNPISVRDTDGVRVAEEVEARCSIATWNAYDLCDWLVFAGDVQGVTFIAKMDRVFIENDTVAMRWYVEEEV